MKAKRKLSLSEMDNRDFAGSISCRSDSSGSISLEASLILPWVVMITFLLLLFSLFVSQGALLYYSSSISAERAAFSWSNSSKETQTGAYPEGQYDELYWRLLDDSLLKGLFGFVSENEGVEVEIYSGMHEGTGSAAVDKLNKIGIQMTSSEAGLTGVLNYNNIGIQRKVGVSLTSRWLPEPLVWLRGEAAKGIHTTSLVVEPTEFIRSFDLVRYYAAKMRSAPEGSTIFREKAAGVLQKRGS